MINPGLNVNKAFRSQVEKCMFTTFVEITHPFIKATLAKKNASVLALIMFYETRAYNPRKYFILSSCVIYTIIKNCVCIDYLYCQLKKLSEIPVGSGGGSKHGDRSFDQIFGIGITDLLMNLRSYHGFLKNINSVVV